MHEHIHTIPVNHILYKISITTAVDLLVNMLKTNWIIDTAQIFKKANCFCTCLSYTIQIMTRGKRLNILEIQISWVRNTSQNSFKELYSHQLALFNECLLSLAHKVPWTTVSSAFIWSISLYGEKNNCHHWAKRSSPNCCYTIIL